MPEGTRPRPEGDRTGSENAETPRSKPFDATKKQFDQQKAGKEKKKLTASERLERLVESKVGEELIGKDKNDLGLGFDKYLGFDAITTINLTKIKAGKLRVFTKGEKYYITTEDKEKGYLTTKNEFKSETITDGLINNIESNIYKVTWDLPNIHAVKRNNWRNDWRNDLRNDLRNVKSEDKRIVITDNTKDLPETLTRPKDAATIQSCDENEWKRILPGTDAGIDLSDSTSGKAQLYELKCIACERLKNYVVKKAIKPLKCWLQNLFQGKKIGYSIRKDVYVSKEGQYRVSDKKPREDGWERVDVDNMSVEQLRKIRERIRDNQGKVECDLKVYAIQPMDQASNEILMTDDSRLVTTRINKDWKMALPGTQIGIEFSSDEDKIEGQKKIYEAFSEKQDVFSKLLASCEELFSKLYLTIRTVKRGLFVNSGGTLS